MVNFFHERGYPSNITNTALHRCQAITREESLRNKDTSNNCQRTPLVLTYHPSIAPVSDIIKRNWKIISEHPSTKDIITDPPLLSLRRDKNTKDYLVRASLPSDGQHKISTGTSPCRRRRYNTCRHVLSTSTVTGPDGTDHIKKNSHAFPHMWYMPSDASDIPTSSTSAKQNDDYLTVSQNTDVTSVYATQADLSPCISLLMTTHWMMSLSPH